MSEIEAILSYWFGPKPETAEELEALGGRWFGGGPAVDAEIGERFGALVARAERGELDGWAETPRGRLALILLLDQFTRNVHRNSPQAFASDAKALALAVDGFERGLFDGLDALERLFAALPLSHAESLEHQRRCVALGVAAVATAPEAWRKFLVAGVDFARKHLDVIARFGRFPHRNQVLGRDSSAEEREYLAYLKLAGQWL
jgi:uncharacterized protein (DUF924 family)